MEDIFEEDLISQIASIDAYSKDGFSDYDMISPTEILALMASPDLIAKTSTDPDANYWTNDNDEQSGNIYHGGTGTIVIGEVGQNTHHSIPVRRVAVT